MTGESGDVDDSVGKLRARMLCHISPAVQKRMPSSKGQHVEDSCRCQFLLPLATLSRRLRAVFMTLFIMSPNLSIRAQHARSFCS